MLVAVIGSYAQPRRSNRRQISDGYGVPSGPVLTGSPSGNGGGRPSYGGGNGGNGGGRPSYKPQGNGGGNGGLFGIKKPDLGSIFGGFGGKKPSGGRPKPSYGAPSGGKPKPSYGAPGGGIGKPSLDLSGIKNVFNGIFGVKKVRIVEILTNKLTFCIF